MLQVRKATAVNSLHSLNKRARWKKGHVNKSLQLRESARNFCKKTRTYDQTLGTLKPREKCELWTDQNKSTRACDTTGHCASVTEAKRSVANKFSQVSVNSEQHQPIKPGEIFWKYYEEFQKYPRKSTSVKRLPRLSKKSFLGILPKTAKLFYCKN